MILRNPKLGLILELVSNWFFGVKIMEEAITERPRRKVFISYSWTNEDHIQWVINLANRLREDGVDVVLDKWDLKEGQDIYSFMESMVNSPEINKVLIICDEGYRSKAEERKGGVGAETLIITPEVYGNSSQEKFIPIVKEKDDNGQVYIPAYIKSRKYIDLSSDEIFEDGYELLLRNIFERPQHRKPALGNPPAWLFEDKKPHYKTSNVIKQLENVLENNPARFNGLSMRFINSFFECLDEVKLNEDETIELDQKIYDIINDLVDLRNDFVCFVELICEANGKIDVEKLVKFFEQLYKYTLPSEPNNIYYSVQGDHFKFLARELLIYTVMVFLDYDRYETAAEFLNAEFFVTDNRGESIHEGFTIFCFGIGSIDILRKERLNSKNLSLSADLMIQRATLKKYSSRKLVETDILMHYLCSIYERDFYRLWFPYTYVYGISDKIGILQRLISKRFFERAKSLFMVDSPEQLKVKITEYDSDQNQKRLGYQNAWNSSQNKFSY